MEELTLRANSLRHERLDQLLIMVERGRGTDGDRGIVRVELSVMTWREQYGREWVTSGRKRESEDKKKKKDSWHRKAF